MNRVEYFNALRLKEIKEKCEDISVQLIYHLLKIRMYSSDYLNIDHWRHEIINWISSISTRKIKSAKFSYLWFLNILPEESETDDKFWETYILNTEYREDKIGKKLDTKRLQKDIYSLFNKMEKYYLREGRSLVDIELLNILKDSGF